MSNISNAFGSTNAWSLSVSNAAGSVAPTDVDLKTAPGSLSAATFKSWTQGKQAEYVVEQLKAQHAKPSDSFLLGLPGKEVRVSIATVNALAFSAEPSGRTLPTAAGPTRSASALELATDPEKLSPGIFLQWTPQDQLTYLDRLGRGDVGDRVKIGTGIKDITALRVDVGHGVVVSDSTLLEPRDPGDRPALHLPGSSVGARSAYVMDRAEELFPTLDGSTVKLQGEKPKSFDTVPSTISGDAAIKTFLDDFSKWHSAHQLEYVKSHGTDGILHIPATGTALLTAFVSQTDPTRLYIAGSLDKAAVAKMSKADQDYLVQTSALAPAMASLKARFGLVGVDTVNVTDVSSSANPPPNVSAKTAVTNLFAYIDGRTTDWDAIRYGTSRTSTASPGATTVSSSGAVETGWVRLYPEISPNEWTPYTKTLKMPDDDRLQFTSQLNLITEQLGRMGVVSPGDIFNKLKELKDRFDRAFAFFDVTKPVVSAVNGGDPGVEDDAMPKFSHVISLDDNEVINQGYRVFMTQERRIAELAKARMEIVRDVGSAIDVPELVYRFQSLYNLQLEAKVVADTEEINQQNALLKTYAAMQDVVNKTLSKFVKTDDGNKRILDRGINDYRNLDESNTSIDERKLIAMFDALDGSGQKHPLERLRSLIRPLEPIFSPASGNANYDLKDKSHTQWSTFGTRLSEAVTVINQNSQIAMNDVNSLDKQRNRHFELANSALSKMNEIISNIARA